MVEFATMLHGQGKMARSEKMPIYRSGHHQTHKTIIRGLVYISSNMNQGALYSAVNCWPYEVATSSQISKPQPASCKTISLQVRKSAPLDVHSSADLNITNQKGARLL